MLSLKAIVSMGGTVSIPREALVRIGIEGQGLVRMSAVGGQVIITRVPLGVVPPERK